MYSQPYYAIETTTPPSGECVTTGELKTWLRLSTSDEDTLLAGLITTARMIFENLTGRIVLGTVFRQDLSSWYGPITLMRGQVSAIADVKYFDNGDALQTLPAWNGTNNGWTSDVTGIPARIWVPGQYPLVSGNVKPVAYVDFTAGWANSSAVPEAIKTGIKLLAGHFFANRQAYTDKQQLPLPMGFIAICDQYRTGLYGSWVHSRYVSPVNAWEGLAALVYEGLGWY